MIPNATSASRANATSGDLAHQSPHTLILTAIVTPVTSVERGDPSLRMADYRGAIRRWLTESEFSRLILVESGMTSILNSELADLAVSSGKVLTEYLFDFAESARKYGKGRSEAMLLDRAVELLPAGACFHKVTGRLFIGNHCELLCQTDAVVFNRHRSSRLRVDTRFWRASRRYYDEILRPLTEKIDDAQIETYIENIYPLDETVTWQSSLNVVGFSGTSNEFYG